MQKATPTAASPETRLVPLNRLRVDERNVRSASGDPARVQADAELVASIRAHGLLENLVVVPRGKTQFGVAAGARRLAALKALAADKAIPKDHPVPCLVVDGEAATESSLAENAVRIAMHPADQVVAFSRLARDGATTEQIAARFGVAERTVQKRVRLGDLPEEVIDAYRAGRINADTAEAFALTADTDFQRSVFEALSASGQLHGHAVRQAIGQRRTRSDAPAALFVGLDAYRAAGGRTEDPLFEDDHVAVLDPNLMEELAIQKLNAVAAKYADAWKWTAAQTEFTWLDQQNHLVVDPERRAALTDEESARLAEAEQRIEQANARLDGDGNLDADSRRAVFDAIAHEQSRCAEIERDRDERDEYAETTRAHAGVVVALDRAGGLDIRRALVRPEDAAAYRAARTPVTGNGNGTDGSTATPDAPDGTHVAPTRPDGGNDAPPPKRNGGYTDALRNDLRVMRTAAVRRALARDPGVATDLLGFALARMVGFGRPHAGHERPILAIRKEHQGLYASDALKASETMKHLDPVPAVDLGWLAETDAATSFRAYRALPEADRASVLAHAVASLALPHLADDHDVSGAHEEAVRNLDLDFPTELTAVGAHPFDADLVWNRMNKALVLSAASDALGDDWSAQREGLKKSELVAAVVEAFRHDPARDPEVDAAAVRWLPPGFVPAGASVDPTPPDSGDTPDIPDSPAAAPDHDSGASVESVESDEADGSAEAAPEGGATGAAGASPAPHDGNGANGARPEDDALPAFLTS